MEASSQGRQAVLSHDVRRWSAPQHGVYLCLRVIAQVRSSSLHSDPTAQRFYRLCGWGLVGASKDAYPGFAETKLPEPFG